MISFKWRHFKKDIILMLVRWYLAYSLSYRDVEELALERGLKVDHSTINCWVIEYAPQLEETFRKRYKRPVGISWRMDETYIKVKGQWVYLYRAVDKEGKMVDFLLSEKRDEPAARAFLEKAIGSNGLPEKVTMDKKACRYLVINSGTSESPEFTRQRDKYACGALAVLASLIMIPLTGLIICAPQ